MKLKFYPYPLAGFTVLLLQLCMVITAFAQNCGGLTATYTATESRCTATGAIQINASGGSGTYNYKVDGPSSLSYTSSSLITGLPPGTYTITVKDIITNCTYQISHVVISGSYNDPRYGLTETDVTCSNGSDGAISVTGLQYGRSPFTFTIVAPSAMGVGLSNSTGTFTGLIPGQYSVQLKDSCGGIQTRTISIQNYTWSISAYSVTQKNCTIYHAVLNLTDSKGNTNSSGTAFNGFLYGIVNSAGDTSWYSTYAFDFDLLQRRKLTFVVKDRCGQVQSKAWSNTTIPNVATNVTISAKTCSGFTATVTGQTNLTSPQYCLYDNSGNAVPGQPCNTTGVFSNIPYGSYCIKITNSCYDTVISRCFSQARAVPAITGNVTLSNYTCTTVTATVTGQQNLTNPQYCIYDNLGNAVSGQPCNTTGIFSNLPYGSYTIKVTDGCTGDVFTLNFSASKRTRSVANNVTTNGYTCTTFNASITGQTNLTNPQYCIVDASGNPIPGIPCNNNGIFNNLPYGSYCINITDGCGDTTIKRCMNISKPAIRGGTANISNKTCTGFTVTISGQANVFNGQYCLQDQSGNPVAGVPCNSTGVFTNVPYGSYCVKTTDGCTGAVLSNCFTVTAPVPAVGSVSISNQTCSGFRATLTGQTNLTNPQYCLFNSLDVQIGSCNTTGVFDITGYGSYYIKTTDGCAGAVFKTPFAVSKPIASVGANVNFSNQNCTSFTASIVGQTNLTNPQYYLKNSSGTVIASNTTGIFNNVAYGSYCIDVVPSCNDTTIERCFTVAADPTTINATASPSCTLNASNINVQVLTGYAPYTVNIYDSANNLVGTASSSSNNISISSLPTLTAGQQYRVVVTGSCGTPATQVITAQGSGLTHNYTITPRCPSSSTQNGSGDLLIAASTNLGSMNLSITQKNFSAVSIGYSFRSGNDFTFSNLDAATYVITYSFTGCTTLVNDTVTIPVYSFPNLAKSAAYQCDNNSFSVGASVSGGVGPFTYEIIGSNPSMPDITTAPQSNPVFTINNGAEYSLIRLRTIDACGNAALNDVSILPLANLVVTSSSACLFTNTTLKTDTIPNATYTWYKKVDDDDSIVVGTNSPIYNIPFMMPSDTGTYVCKVSVNSGCLTEISYFHLKDACSIVLPGNVVLKGNAQADGAARLNWIAPNDAQTKEYIIERSFATNDHFEPVGAVDSYQSPLTASYSYTDNGPQRGTNFYRLRIIDLSGKTGYSNIVAIETGASRISVYPNPAKDVLNIDINGSADQRYRLLLYDAAGRIVQSGLPVQVQNGSIRYRRGSNITTGFYVLQVTNLNTGEVNSYKIAFE